MCVLFLSSFLGFLLDVEQLVALVVEDEIEVVGYAVASVDAKQFYSRMKTDFIPSMQTKYPFTEGSFTSSMDQVSTLSSFLYSDINNNNNASYLSPQIIIVTTFNFIEACF